MDKITITQTPDALALKTGGIEEVSFTDVFVKRLSLENVCLTNAIITNANLSDIEIEGAQLGGAYIHNIGMPPADHPLYDPAARQRPLKFEDCTLEGSEFLHCDLSHVRLHDCTITGMQINGIPVADLLQAYAQQQGK
ncbi:pentapeptide repeat-containing protein [Chitinophaga agrisoli]|uniref:Pentapeptide repeat-containing protein n=1 Tax=Chitinophaga agrisoli TaxID=2607653 RepID=A0A5B2VTX1_9BACT|nr:pentapeptide repeat-containing protein [Chitinophaga agrisoli]KAA2243243.1 pentapeptide repeat-containing protein [Chitinophaga agrisoli]